MSSIRCIRNSVRYGQSLQVDTMDHLFHTMLIFLIHGVRVGQHHC
jgi:hypothetical protein